MKKIFILFATMLVSLSLWASVSSLNFSEPTELPTGFAYSNTNKPSIAENIDGKNCVYVTNGGGGAVESDCFKNEGGLDESKGKRWMGFTVDEDCSVVITIHSSKKTWTIYKKGAVAHSTFSQTANQWDEWTVTDLKKGESYIITTSNSQCYVASMIFTSSCSAPDTPLTLSADKTTDILAGDVITFSTNGGNGAEVKYYDGENEIANPWTATKGQHSITAVQDDNAGICGATTEPLVLNVITTDPVTAATISASKTEIIIGEEVALTCVAENADTFQWYKGENAIDGATESTYTFSSDAAGAFAFHCTATNAYTSTPVASNTLSITVTLLCGELIRATHKNKNSADISGIIGGQADKNTQDNGKLGSNGHYFGVKLASGSFMEGDVVTIHASALNDCNAATIFSDKGETLIGTAGFDENNDCILELEETAEWIYIYRQSSACNPTVEYIAVERPCNGGDPVLKASESSVNLRATAVEPTATATVVFSGKNLPAGTYDFSLTEAEGLSVSPTSVTVPENGKFSQEVTVSFAATADANIRMAELGLTIDTLSKTVLIAYSAALSKAYGESIDFEAIVMEHGKDFAIATELENKNFDFLKIDALDSLDNTKPNDNEPYLGLKLKASGAFIACWLKANDTIQVKIGHVEADINFYKGSDMMTKTAEQLADEVELIVTEDTYVKFETTSTATVVVKHILIKREEEPVEGIEDVMNASSATKILRDGQMLIIRDGKVYTVQGIRVE